MVHIYEIEPSSKKEDIDLLNLKLNNKSNKIMYVVHKPGCPACDAFIPNWNKFQNKMKHNNKNDIVLAKINIYAMASIDLKDKHHINGVPHIVMQNGNTIHPYHGNRLPEDLEKWLSNNTIKLHGGKKTKKRKWSLKYKRSIKCKKPKGFSQKQYCKRVNKKTRRKVNKKTRRNVKKISQRGGGLGKNILNILKTMKYKINNRGLCKKPFLPNVPQKPPQMKEQRWKSYVKLAHEINKKLNGIPFETLTPDDKVLIEKEAKKMADKCEIPKEEIDNLMTQVMLDMMPSPPKNKLGGKK